LVHGFARLAGVTVRRFVLALHDVGGTVPPMMAIAEELANRGHAVTVLSQRGVERRAHRVGCDFVAFTNPDYATDRPIEEQVEAVAPMMTGRGPGDELLRTIEATSADVVVVDANLAGVAAAAEVSVCRSTILLHSLYETYVDTWFGEFWPFIAPAINETRRAFGLADGASWSEIFEPHDRIYAAVPEIFDAPTTRQPPTTLRHTGFLVPTATAADVAFEREGDEPTVLVSLSTTEMGQGPLLQSILDAFAGQDVRGVVTTGGQRVDPGLRVPSNVVLHDYLPHASVLPHADAVITHAGLGTVAAALSHAVPIVCTPIARDQPLNARRVAEVGAGVVVPAATASPDAVRAALHEVLTDVRHRQGAERVAAASARAGGAVAVADDLEHLSR
jgi:UDP:flavonoid glycosyltransferase YjiC (YdhE family)